MLRSLLLVTFMLSMNGCREGSTEPGKFASGINESTSKSIGLPKLLKQEIDKRYVEHIRGEYPKDVRDDAEILNSVPRDFLDINVSIWQTREGTIRENQKYKLIRGGGAIDLARIINGHKGSMYLKFEVNRTGFEDESLGQFRVYYLSASKKKVIDDDSYGADCGVLVDITDRVLLSRSGEPIRANITDDRHVPALTGNYYFIHFSGEVLHLAAVQIEDSRFPAMKCKSQ